MGNNDFEHDDVAPLNPAFHYDSREMFSIPFAALI